MTAWNNGLSICGFGLCAVVAVVYHLMPRLTRPEIYFAVTVPAAFRAEPEAKRALRRYRTWVFIHTAAALALLAVGIVTHRPALLSAAVLWQTLGSVQAFLAARKVVLPHAAAPTSIREASLVLERRALPGGVVAQLAPFAILAAAAGFLAQRWQEILTGVVLCAMMVLFAYGILHGSRRVSTVGESGRREWGFRRATLVILLGAEYLIALTFAGISLMSLLATGSATFATSMMLIELVAVVVVLVVLTRWGQGGTRAASDPEGAVPVGDRTADARWRWGIFYVDPDDPAVFVEKRFGIGYTLNLGNRRAWMILALLVIVPVMTSLFALHRTG